VGVSEPPATDLEAALGDLDRATRSFAERLGSAAAGAPGQAPRAADLRPGDAEREARECLEDARRRADSLVAALVAAGERDAATIRREAEDEIRAQREAMEAEAARQLEEARMVAERMVADRQQRIAEISDSIAERGRALSAAMEDAERIGAQFDAFVRALSAAAARVAADDEHRPAILGREAAGSRRRGSIAA